MRFLHDWLFDQHIVVLAGVGPPDVVAKASRAKVSYIPSAFTLTSNRKVVKKSAACLEGRHGSTYYAEERMRRRAFVVGPTMVAVAGTAPARQAASGDSLPNVTVVDQEGRPHRFYDDLVKGRVVTLNFFFASCGETCPLVTQNLRQVQDLLGDRVGRDIFMYSLTLQPEVDMPEALKDYAAMHGIRPGWRFLTGAKDDIERLRHRLGFASPDPELDVIKDEHTGLLRYGNDALDRWAGCPALSRPEWIVKAITSEMVAAT